MGGRSFSNSDGSTTDAAGRFARLAFKQVGDSIQAAARFVPLPALGPAAKRIPCPIRRVFGGIGCFEAGTLVADGTNHTTQYVATLDASSRWYWGVTVGALGVAAVFLAGTRRAEDDEKKRKRDALDRLFGGGDLDQGPDVWDDATPWDEPEEFSLLARRETDPAGETLASATDRLLSSAGLELDGWETCSAVLDLPRPARTIKRIAPRHPASEPMAPPTASRRMPNAARRSRSTKRPSPRFSLRWPLIGLLLLIAGISGFMAMGTSRQPQQPPQAASAPLPPGTVELDGVRFRPIETYDVCDRVLGENPELTDEDRAAFGPEPNPATWKLLYVLAPKHDGSTAKVRMVQPPEWLAQHRPEVGKTVPIWVPECGIEGMAEVLAIGPCPPVKPGPGPVVLATFEHEVSSTVDLHVTGVTEPIGCTGNHPFWSEDRQDFVRADELRPGETLATLEGTTQVTALTTRPGPQTLHNLEVQGEHVYLVTTDGVLVHNGSGLLCKGLHHLFPRGLGSKIPLGDKALTFLEAWKHTKLHRRLTEHLNSSAYTKTIIEKGRRMTMTMDPQRWSGRRVRRYFSAAERYAALDDFYRTYNGGEYYQRFLNEVYEMTRRGAWQ